ncbi:hypothetical protein K435DRAFT_714363 [Dendrothele bispora CBS 962.96]|uniref:C2 domain-containing protein n=1 Tax=Dendrothele bispora (strain CBS 962.96) TaxID=1314807 RepID=A0A4S8MP65_DENBC|nr:hypothetical protein K435DRAFT_714363 [Dendrothele bispora CBS 962.96]
MEPYSEKRPVPTIQAFEQKQAEYAAQAEATEAQDQLSSQLYTPPSSPGVSTSLHSRTSSRSSGSSRFKNMSEGKKEKEEMKKRMTAPKEKPTDKVKTHKGERLVNDPTTGQDVLIKDADFKDYPDPSQVAHQAPPPPDKAYGNLSPTHTAPHPARPGNVSLYPYLPAPPPALAPLLSALDYLQIALAASFAVVWFICAFPSQGRWYIPFTWASISFTFRSAIIGGLGYAAVTAVSMVQRKLEKEFDRVRLEMHRQRGEKFSPPTPESVEWLNAFVKTIWGLVNPDMFVPMADMVEDIMQQSLPGFVDAVRISDIGQGSNPFRIVSMRALPDKPTSPTYPKEEWIDQGTTLLQKKKEEDAKNGIDSDQTGDYVNYEVAFAYQALPGHGSKLKEKNIHLLIEFFLGIYDWLHIPVPIWIQVEGIVGTIRLRLQFIPEYPYVRNVTFTFMGVPAVEVSAIPLSSKLPNVLDLPLISKFVKMAIKAGTAELVAPKSMMINLQELLSGSVIGDTRAKGVFLITIHHAEGLSAQDSNGRSDPYIVLAYAKFGKPLYSTRIILGDLNPCWEETAALLVSDDEIRAGEDVSLMLWDSDRWSNDDLIGRVQIPVKTLINELPKNQMMRREDKLMGFEDADQMDGTLHWSIGYFDKVPLRKELELPPETPPPPPPKTPVEMEMRPGDKAPNPGARDLPPPPPDVRRTPPDTEFPSGILSIVVHQINNLERQNLRGNTGEREGQAGQDTDDPSEQSDNLPSGYVEVIINDDLVYKTRVKQYTSMPFFEAGTEKFIRDWRDTVVRLVVRDSRLREKDPILGVVNLKLADIFTEGSEVTRLFSIEEGIGFGRMNVSLLFRGINCQLPTKALGWDTGTVEITAPIQLKLNATDAGTDPTAADAASKLVTTSNKLVVSTTDSTETLPASPSANTEAGADVTWDLEKEKLRLPVYNRYSASLTFEVGSGSVIAGLGPGRKSKNGPQALAMLWLKDLVDDEEVEVELPVIAGDDLRQVRQNVIYELVYKEKEGGGDSAEDILRKQVEVKMNGFTAKTHSFKVVGTIRTKIRLDRGLDEDHEHHAKTQARRHAFETYDHVEGEAAIAERNAHAYDDGVLDSEEKKALRRAHKKQLENRQRGVNGFRPYRTGKWMKQGLMSRIKVPERLKSQRKVKREPLVQSEA